MRRTRTYPTWSTPTERRTRVGARPRAGAGRHLGYRNRTRKTQLAQLAPETGRQITVPYLPSGNIKVEPDRAPAVFPHHHELARETSEHPRRHRPEHRRNHHPCLPDRPRPGDRRASHPPSLLPRRLKLHRPRDPARQIPAADDATDQPPPRGEPQVTALCALRDPELTGMTRQQLSEVIGTLAPARSGNASRSSTHAEATHACSRTYRRQGLDGNSRLIHASGVPTEAGWFAPIFRRGPGARARLTALGSARSRGPSGSAVSSLPRRQCLPQGGPPRTRLGKPSGRRYPAKPG